MPVKVELPAELGRYTSETSSIDLPGSTVGEVLAGLFEQFPDLKPRVVNDRGELYPYLPVFHNREKLSATGYEDRSVRDGDCLEIVALASGG